MLQLRWNGLGAPVLARTMALTKVGDDMRLEVAVDRADALAQLEMLGFALNCPGKVAAFTEMRRDKMRKLAIYTVESGIPCDYPDLIVQGRPQTRDLATETDIASIRLVRQ
jgi:hypothetical protein